MLDSLAGFLTAVGGLLTAIMLVVNFVQNKKTADLAKQAAENAAVAVAKVAEVSVHTNGITEKMTALAEQVGIGKGRREKADEIVAEKQQDAVDLAKSRKVEREEAVLDAESAARKRTAEAILPAMTPAPAGHQLASPDQRGEVPTKDKRVARATEEGTDALNRLADATEKKAGKDTP